MSRFSSHDPHHDYYAVMRLCHEFFVHARQRSRDEIVEQVSEISAQFQQLVIDDAAAGDVLNYEEYLHLSLQLSHLRLYLQQRHG